MPASPDRKWTRSICVTPDGVVLHNTGYFPTGEKTDELRAIDVKRGSVQRSDVLPPRQMLDWNAWATRSREPSGAKSAMSLNYELTLARERAGEDLGDPTETIAETHLADGAGVLVARCSRAGFDNAKLTLARGGSVVWGEDMLRLQRTDESLLESHSPKPVALRQRPGLVQGKRCYWFDTFAGADDATRIECRTRDGVPLRIEATNWTMPRNWIATQFSKGTVKPGSNLPPPQLLDWAYWGWPELSLAKPESSVQGPRQSRG
jgi:hypothetical protein